MNFRPRTTALIFGLGLLVACGEEPSTATLPSMSLSTVDAQTTVALPATTAATAAPTTTAPPPTDPSTTAPPPTTAAPAAPAETVSQKNARQTATSYLKHSSFSRSGLIGQLEYEGFTTEDATYGVDALNADWSEQAAKTAAGYLSHSSFSRSGLIDQLLYEGFTPEQAEYGVSTTGL